MRLVHVVLGWFAGVWMLTRGGSVIVLFPDVGPNFKPTYHTYCCNVVTHQAPIRIFTRASTLSLRHPRVVPGHSSDDLALAGVTFCV